MKLLGAAMIAASCGWLCAGKIRRERLALRLLGELVDALGSMEGTIRFQRLPLPQWGVTPHPRGSQKQLHQHDGCKAGQAEKADDAGCGRGDGDIEPRQGRE